MIAASPGALRPRCHVNIGVQKAVLCSPARLPGRSRRLLITARDARSGNGDTQSGRESPLASVSDAVIGFFDDITRGSVSIDEDDAPDELKAAAAAADAAVAAMPAVASEAAATAVAAAAAAAATADAAAQAAAEAAGVSKAAGEWEGAAIAAVAAAAAATSSGGSSTAAKSLETYAAVVQQDLSIAGSSSSSSSSSGSSGSGSSASKLQTQPVGSSGSNGGGGSSGSNRSRQVVTDKAVAGAGGELQAATLSLSATTEDGAVGAGQVAIWALKGLVGVGLLQAFKSGVEAAMQQFGLTTFPPAVASMLAVPLLLSAVGSQTADKLVQLYDSCVAAWTTDLLGLFFVPAVAILPVLLRGMQGPDLAGLLSVAVLSAAATLVLTAKAAAAWTSAQTATPAQTSTPAAAAGGYRLTSGPAAPVLLSLSFLAAAGPLALTRFDPVNFGAKMALPVGFAWSLMGFVAARVYLQQQQKKGGKPGWPSPVLAGAVAAKLGVAWHASIMGWGYRDALSLYYVGDVLGAGDVLAAPLGAALTAVGFLIYKHRATLALPAIAATAALSAAFSVATSVAAAKVLGVSADWARAFIPRSVTDSTASHFARAIGAPSECTGLVVILQAAVTIFMGRLILKAVNGGKTSPAAAGTAVGSTAGLMGVAGVCGSNEVALANGAVAYAVMVVIGSCLSSVPAITAVLAALVA